VLCIFVNAKAQSIAKPAMTSVQTTGVPLEKRAAVLHAQESM
jgi:hypothetical protein